MRLRILTSLLLLLLSQLPASAAEPVARVVDSEGVVLVLRATGSTPLRASDPLFVDDEVRTGHDGRLTAQGEGGLRLVIGPGSEVRLRRWLVEPRGSRLEAVLAMVTGVMRLFTEGAVERAVDVETRAAVASVRSTEWLVEATGAGTGVLSIEGEVTVTGTAATPATVRLDPGLGTDVVLGAAPSPPATWGAARLARLLALVPRP